MDFKKAKKILHRHSIALHKTVKHNNGVMLIKDPDTKKFKLQICVEKELPEHKKLKKMKAGKVLRSDDKKATKDELEVDFLVVGKIEANLIRTSKWFPTPGAPGGVSIGHKDITAGTLGCSVFNACDRYILSNNHVLANCNDGEAGDAIYQPGPFDIVGEPGPEDKIGELHSYVTIDFWDEENPDVIPCNEIDAALCLPTEDSYITNALIEDDCSTEYFPAGLGDWEDTFDAENLVKKSGRTSGVTTGYIIGYGNFWVGYAEDKYAYMTCQIVTGVMATGGDSGSLLIDSVTDEAIGLCFAGSDCLTLFNNACYIAEAFGITFYPEKGVTLLNELPSGKLLVETDGDDVKLVVASPNCPDCPCTPVQCDVVGCRENTPEHISVTLSGIELYTDCCAGYVDCEAIYPEAASRKYTINVNKTYILERLPSPDYCEWFLELGELVGGICYQMNDCAGDTDPMIWGENALRVVTGGSEGQVAVEVFFGGHLVIEGQADASNCVDGTISNDDQRDTDCDNIFSKGSATVVGLVGHL